jgi:mannan endo-1,4-beta-mannosidase
MLNWVCVAFILLGAALVRGSDLYVVSGTAILKNGEPWAAGGCNAFDQFGYGGKPQQNIRIVREVVNDMSECPIGSSALGTSMGFLHGLQEISDRNRADGRVTILCMFGWDTKDHRKILGHIPSAMPFYAPFKSRLALIAKQFAGQPDVWVDVWNEPYAWDNVGFTESQWLSDMNAFYGVIRAAGNKNIILIPGQAEEGEETVLKDKARDFLAGKINVVAEIHCYNGWTRLSQAESENRIQAIHRAGWALILGEVGPDQYVSDCSRVLNASITQRVSALAWSWSAADGSSLWSSGTTTAWGNQFFSYLPRYEKVSGEFSGQR